MSSATLSQLTNKGMKSQDTIVIFILFLFISGEYWDHTICDIHSLFPSIYKYSNL